MEDWKKQSMRIHHSCVGMGFLYGMLMHLAIPGLNTSLRVAIPEQGPAIYNFYFCLILTVLAYVALTLIRCLVENVVQVAAQHDVKSLEDMLVFVERRFAAGALVAFSLLWTGSDFFSGVPLRTAHFIIVAKVVVAGWCLMAPTNETAASLAKAKRSSPQSTPISEEAGTV